MAQHISIRVPWHDDGWKGSVCKEPSANMACLKLKNIMENRDDAFEQRPGSGRLDPDEESVYQPRKDDDFQYICDPERRHPYGGEQGSYP